VANSGALSHYGAVTRIRIHKRSEREDVLYLHRRRAFLELLEEIHYPALPRWKNHGITKQAWGLIRLTASNFIPTVGIRFSESHYGKKQNERMVVTGNDDKTKQMGKMHNYDCRSIAFAPKQSRKDDYH